MEHVLLSRWYWNMYVSFTVDKPLSGFIWKTLKFFSILRHSFFETCPCSFSFSSIVGLYTTIVLVASRFVRSLFSGVSFHIMFDDMPYVDRILQLCLDIYLVRESGELHLEEDLFAKLIFLYRSPETLIKWTRYPQRPNSPWIWDLTMWRFLSYLEGSAVQLYVKLW